MNVLRFLGSGVIVSAVIVAGCDVEPAQRRNVNPGVFGVEMGDISNPPPADSGRPDSAASSNVSTPPPTASGQSVSSSSSSSPPPPAPAAAANTAVPQSGPPPAERVRAEAGVGVKGRTLGGSYLETVFSTKFHIEQKAEFMKVQHAMNLYNAMHDRYPSTHDEFMETIVKANNIQLPRLPDGERYIYDPENAELMVERPR